MNKQIMKIARKVARYTTAFVLLIVSALGFSLTMINPTEFISPYLTPDQQFLVSDLLYQLYSGDGYLIAVAGVSVWLTFLGLLLLVKSPVQTIKSIGRGIKASPKAFLRSPITTYRSVVRFRNWALQKIEFIESESAKWKTTFKIIKSPYSVLRMMGLNPAAAISLLVGASTVGGGVIVNETILADRSFNRGDSGVYAASLVGNGELPLDVPTEYVEGYNTLRIDLGSTSVRSIVIENVSVGTAFTGSALPSGEQNVVQIGGSVVNGGNNTRLEVGTLIFEKSRCKKLTLTDIQAHELVVVHNSSDGQSIAPSPGTSRMRAIGGGHHQAEAMVTSGGTYDRIVIQAPASGVNGKVDTLRLSNLWTKGGDCVLSRMNIGTLRIEKNEVGMGNGFATKEFTIATNVTASVMTINGNVEVTIAEPATQ